MQCLLNIRPASKEDCEPLMQLRNHYIAVTQSSFDEQPLTLDCVSSWIATFSADGPYRLLVAAEGGSLVGFASSQRYREHAAFRHTVETSIYANPGSVGKGVGSALYAALFAAIAGQAIHRAVVGIALPNEASVRLHTKFGFTEVGVFDEYAVKNGRYISSVWMQRRL